MAGVLGILGSVGKGGFPLNGLKGTCVVLKCSCCFFSFWLNLCFSCGNILPTAGFADFSYIQVCFFVLTVCSRIVE